jgi:hypothetical protein
MTNMSGSGLLEFASVLSVGIAKGRACVDPSDDGVDLFLLQAPIAL